MNHTILFKKYIRMYALQICQLPYPCVVINRLISTMHNVDNNSIDAALNHLVSIV